MAIIGSILTVFITILALYLFLAHTGIFTWFGEIILSGKSKIDKEIDKEWEK